MNAERFQRIKDILARALALPLPEREGFIHAEAGTDGDLAREVLELLPFDDEDAEFRIGLPELAPEALLGREIGGCRLLGVLGEGGMGVVYRAEQTVP